MGSSTSPALSFDAQGNPITQSTGGSPALSFDAQGNPIQAASATGASPSGQQSSGTPHEGMLDHFIANHPTLRQAGDLAANISGYNLLAGVGAGVEQTAAGLDTLGRKVLGGQMTGAEKALQREAAKPTEGAMQTVGKGAEAAGEFFTGEELLGMLGKAGTVMNAGEKLKTAQQLATVINRIPYIGKALKIGMEAAKQGALGAGQEYVKTGGDTDAAESAGMVTGGLSAGLGALGPAAQAVAKITPGVRDLEGVAIPYIKSQISRAGRFIEGGDVSDLAPKIAQQQQDAAHQVINNVASRATNKILNMINDTRQYFSRMEPEMAANIPESTQPFKFDLSKPGRAAGTAEETAAAEAQSKLDQETLDKLGDKRAGGKLTPAEQQQWQQAWDRESGEGRTTTSLSQATKHLQNLHDLYMSPEFDELSQADQTAINETRQRLSDQIQMSHASSRFSPLDVDGMTADTHTFGHVAAHAEAAIQPILTRMDQAAKGTIGVAQRAVANAAEKLQSADSADAFKAATEQFKNAHADLDNLINRYSSAVSRSDIATVNKVRPYVQKFQELHNTFQNMMNGVTWEEQTGDGLQQVMTGSARNFQSWLDRPGNTQMLDDMVGKDTRTNLKELTLLMSKVTPQRHMAQAAVNISKLIDPNTWRWAGVGVGGLLAHSLGVEASAALPTAMAARQVVKFAATNPRIGNMLRWAVEHNVRPDVYAPQIARFINGMIPYSEQQPEEAAPEQQPAGAQQ